MSEQVNVSEDQNVSDSRKDENGRVLDHEQAYVTIVPDYVLHVVNSAKDEIIDAMNQRFDAVDDRLANVEIHMNDIHLRLEGVEDKLKNVGVDKDD